MPAATAIQPLGVAIAGLGFGETVHLPALSSCPLTQPVALWHPRAERLEAACSRSGLGGHSDFDALLADPAVEAVVIAAGKPVFCEKPLGASLDDARAMTAAAEASGLPNMIGFNYVRTPATRFVRQLLAEGAIGEVTWFRGEHTEDFLADPALPATWRTSGRANGAMGDLAPHIINCMLALMGPVWTMTIRRR